MSEITRGVIGMPFKLAMGSEMSRRQFHACAQEVFVEKERLEAQVATLKADPNSWQSGYDEGRNMGTKTALPERDQLRAENEALRKDAERWRFVRNPVGGCSPFAIWSERKHLFLGKFADTAIDEAMSKEASHD